MGDGNTRWYLYQEDECLLKAEATITPRDKNIMSALQSITKDRDDPGPENLRVD